MATIADYSVLRDGAFDLESGEERELPSFFAPQDIVPGTNLAKAILSYKARPLQQPPFAPYVELDISLKYQALDIEEVVLKGDTVHGLWEAFPADRLSTLVANVFVFRSNSGRVRISDVILWYQRDI